MKSGSVVIAALSPLLDKVLKGQRPPRVPEKQLLPLRREQSKYH